MYYIIYQTTNIINGKKYIGKHVTNDLNDVSNEMMDASAVLQSADMQMYVGYLTSEGVPPNGAPYSFGIYFPERPQAGSFFLRTDYLPNRLFRYDGSRWVIYQDKVRMTMNQFGNQDTETGEFAGDIVRQIQKTTFINNANTSTIAGKVVPERQSLSKALRPKADN